MYVYIYNIYMIYIYICMCIKYSHYSFYSSSILSMEYFHCLMNFSELSNIFRRTCFFHV